MLFWIFAGAEFFWLAILFFVTWENYLTRYNFASTLSRRAGQQCRQPDATDPQ